MPVQAQQSDLLTKWDELEFVDMLGTRNCLIRLDTDAPTAPIVLAVWYEPNVELPAHRHASSHVEVVLEGSLCVNGRWENPGSIRIVPASFSYGPLIAGPEGCKALEFFQDGVAALLAEFDDPAAMQNLLAGADVVELNGKLEKLLGGPAPAGLFDV